MGLIEGYPTGSDITIMNTFYQFKTKDIETGKWIDDFICIIFKDNVTGEKKHQFIFNPEYTFYVSKEEFIPDHPLFFDSKEHLNKITVPYNQLDKKIAELTGNMEFYQYNIQNKNRGENRKLHTDPSIFFSDVNIEDHYRYLFAKEYTNNIGKINKAFYDIECDTRNMSGDFVKSGECPINLVGLCDEKSNRFIMFALRNPDNPQIEEVEQQIINGEINQKYLHDFVEEKVGGWKQAKRFKVDELKYDAFFFDEEIELITSFFQMVHFLDPDFIMGWNSSAFDLQYFIDRIYELGYEPADIMCNPDFEIKIVKNFIDTRNINENAERGDYAVISGNPVWMDSMIQFCSRRKAIIGSFTDFKLDTIGELIAKVKKLPYHHITHDIAMLPWLAYLIFFLYNFIDVIVVKAIETKTQDIEYIFSKCIVNNTSYRKGHRQTIYLINRMAKEFDKLGYIIGNNCNRWNEKPPKFLGALVGNPLHTTDYAKLDIDGRTIMVANNLIDNDFKSLYPSIDMEDNIAPNTLIGKIEIDHVVYMNENAGGFDPEKFSRSGEFVENMVTDNVIEFCNRWLHLAGIHEILEDMKEFADMNCKYGAKYQNMPRKIDGKVHQSPIYSLIESGVTPAVVIKDKVPNAIVFFGDLKDNQLSNNFERITQGCIDLCDDPPLEALL